MKITIEGLAKSSGVIICRCGPEWGGTWAYKIGNTTVCGYRTEKATYLGWFRDKFGSSSKIIERLIRNQK